MSLSLDRTKSIQGFRLLFVIGVVFLHAGKPFIGEGEELCSFFFIASGFLYSNRCRGLEYVRHKYVQLYPVYLFFLAIMTVGIFVRNRTLTFIEPDFFLHLVLLQSFAVGNAYTATSYLGPAWFLSSLLFCYAMAPSISKIIGRLRRKHSLLLLVSLYVVGVCYLTFIKGQTGNVWWRYINPVFRFGEYMLGMLLGQCIHGIEEKTVRFQMFPLLLCAAYLMLISLQIIGDCSGILHIVIIAFIYVYRSPWLDAVMGNKFVLHLSHHCLFIFLGHFPFLLAFSKIGLPAIGAALLSIVVCLLLGEIYLHLNIRKKNSHA